MNIAFLGYNEFIADLWAPGEYWVERVRISSGLFKEMEVRFEPTDWVFEVVEGEITSIGAFRMNIHVKGGILDEKNTDFSLTAADRKIDEVVLTSLIRKAGEHTRKTA